ITGRQSFWTSRLQAFCSSGVPLRCGSPAAMALEETGIDNRISAKRKLRIVFLHSEARENSIPISGWHGGTDLLRLQMPRNPQQRASQKRCQMRPNLRRSAPEGGTLMDKFINPSNHLI